MLCIDLSRLAIVIISMIIAFNFVTVIVILFYAKGWNKTADKVFYQRHWGINDNSHYGNNNEIDDMREQIKCLDEKLDEKEDKKKK